MYQPISQNDRDFVKAAMSAGLTEQEAWNLLSDQQDEITAEGRDSEEDEL